eukprot:TRINITY_DN636_c0_g1_i1.p1 TRINITY_DN636_c0_g1~~TRINITY_DN636_c0_g1_i1.p1  ORF type:complete len:160 (+),score=44.42 TRINITY_DN636_c0_g1_i1:49-480(+)
MSLLVGLSRPLTQFVSLIYPAYRSFKALKSPGKEDDRDLLIYWILIGFFSFIEFFLDVFISWLPLYYPLKLLFIIWLQLPQTQGAKKLYNGFIEPYLNKHEGNIDKAIASGLVGMFQGLIDLGSHLLSSVLEITGAFNAKKMQ